MTTSIGVLAQKEISQSYRQLMTSETGGTGFSRLPDTSLQSIHIQAALYRTSRVYLYIYAYICNNNRQKKARDLRANDGDMGKAGGRKYEGGNFAIITIKTHRYKRLDRRDCIKESKLFANEFTFLILSSFTFGGTYIRII